MYSIHVHVHVYHTSSDVESLSLSTGTSITMSISIPCGNPDTNVGGLSWHLIEGNSLVNTLGKYGKEGKEPFQWNKDRTIK